MAEQNYSLEASPVYNPAIRALRDTDPARASTVFNPLFERIINNTHAVKLAGDTLSEKVSVLEEAPSALVRGTCGSAAATVSKTASVPGFSPEDGATVCVVFTNGSSAVSPTLNINSGGAKPLVYNGNPVTAQMITAGMTALLQYTGESWELLNPSPSAFGVPAGCIMLWSGAITAIPTGWALCDGTNGTPNLRDRFVVGAGSSYAVGNSGGSSSVTLSVSHMPSHSHTLEGGLSTDGAHTHSINGGSSGQTGGNVYNPVSGYSTTINTHSSGSHTHMLTATIGSAGSGSAHENRPPYYALAYIMKVQVS